MDLLLKEVPASSLVVAIDPGKAFNRVWLTSGERGLIGDPVSLPVTADGFAELERLIGSRRPALCTGPGLGRSSAAGRARCGCSRPQRLPLPGPSWALVALRPTIATARRWSGFCAREPADTPSLRW